MGISVATKSVALRTLEVKAGKKLKTKQRDINEAPPLVKTRRGGGKKSKRKGASFEKTIAKIFAAYYGCRVFRTPGSGGWATSHDFGPRGDLVFTHKRINKLLHVECKKRELWDLSDLLTGMRENSSIDNWWAQTVRDCGKKIPMLIFARNRIKSGKNETMGTPPLVMMRMSDLSMLESKAYKPNEGVQWACDLIRKFIVENDIETRIVITLSDLVRFIRPPRKTPRWKSWVRGEG